MKQSTFSHRSFPGLHVAIIMDGNGRWATARGLPRVAGHREGARAVRRVVEGAPGLGIGTLTLFAFSADNWQRPLNEVAALMQLFEDYLKAETPRCVKEGIKLGVIGRRDRLPPSLRLAVEAAEAATAHGRALHLRLAVAWHDGLTILVEDDGVGLGNGGPASEGSGQGLALHSTMMAVVGGSLAVESLPGAYTRVTLALLQG